MGIYEKPIHRRPIDYVVRTTKPKTELDTPLGPARIGPYQPGDEAGIVELFNSVFPVTRTLDQWNWQFRDRPGGHHTYLGRLGDGTVVSQFTGLPATTKVRDRTVLFAQIVDSMVHPKARGGLKSRGLFGLTLLAHSYEYGFLDKECVQMGLPNPWAYRLGKQTLYYVPLTKTYTHSKSVDPEPALDPLPEDVKGLGNLFKVAIVDRLPDDFEELRAKVESFHEIIAIHDAAFMTWRYRDNPYHDYDFLELRTPDGVLVGFTVMRENWLDEPWLGLAEWMVDEVEGAGEAMATACEYVARRAGMNRVRCLLNHMAEESRAFEDRNYWLERTDFRLVAHSYAPEFLTESDINRHWYYTLGDFDVI